ncbi:hypothetical protein BYT27DRAFT_7180281 [Phlegmacium glaucopus]|nr:hypothetical protein BYT27DRAFT_7180281 [Phlegmacium glaucopus]
MDDEDWTNDYPMTEQYKDAFEDIIPRWRISPLAAYDTTQKFIKPNDLDLMLRHSLVLVHFKLKHYAIRDKKTNSVGTNTFTALATQVKILEHGADRRPTAYKTATNSNVPAVESEKPHELSKADGKKRAREEDDEVTATDGETSITNSPSTKKHKQKK